MKKSQREYFGLELNDINENLTILKSQIKFLERFGVKDTIPCLTIGKSIIPIDIFQYFENREKRLSLLPDFYDEYYYRHFFMEELIDRFLNRIEKSLNKNVTNQNLESVKSNVKNSLSSFIEMRHASFFNHNIVSKISKFFRGGGGSPPSISSGARTKYLTVTVNTNNHGLDILASPAYFVTWKKFGSPTSPVAGYLIPGTYIFGGSGVGVPTFTHDSTPVDIPPNLDITITTF